MIALMIALGAAIGAPTRYLVDRSVTKRHSSVFPAGTIAVNLVASFGLGVLAGASPSTTLSALVGTGFCGALSTYSTFGFETMRLAQTGKQRLAVINVAASVVLGLLAAALGWWLASAV
jgi:CrcB protein